MVIAGIGYQGRTPDDLIGRLKKAGVRVVVDVRELPWSRRPGFSKTRLRKQLEEAGLEYVHLRAAGNPKAIRTTSRSVDECLARYRAYLRRHSAALKTIRELAETQSVALLCFESEHEQCHRSVILEEMASRWGALEIRPLE